MTWYEDDELWKNFYHCMFDDDSFQLAETQVPQLLSMLNHSINRVLDIGCGPGRHCLAFAKMGYQVTGVDTSQYLLNKAIDKAQTNKLSINYVDHNMLNYQNSNSYDLIINMFNSFGYFDTPSENQKVIANAYDNLSDTGTLIIDTVGKETLARIIEPVHLTEYDNGDIRVERPLLIDNMQIFSNQWLLIKGDSVFRRSYQHYVYTPIELTQMCMKAGFDNVRIYGSLDGDEYDLESERLVVVAEKR